ncbi:MAG: DEAD/DEAH box helicase [Planctomycetota bacterium]|jgi:ATP-dependent RNA helicase RhlE
MTDPGPFDEFGLDDTLLRAVRDLGYIRPTPVQEQAIPVILKGRDLVGTALTGTGKTAAFLLPTLQRLLGGKRGRTRVLILCPTRELAVQVAQDVRDLGKHTRLQSGVVYGGSSFQPQTKALRRGADLIVATPGRLLDHIGRGNANFSALEVLILDEADRMLDMGFLPDIRRILRRLPTKRQTLLFSATMPPEISELSKSIMRDPARVAPNPTSSTPMAITHAVYPVNKGQKLALLLQIVRRTSMPSVLVFTGTKFRADRVLLEFEKHGYRVGVLHGDRSQRERTKALSKFKKGETQILVATDIAARGLDIEDISHGRTARVEAEGEAFTLASPEEEPQIRRIEAVLGRSLPRVTLPDFPYEQPTLVLDRRGGFLKSPEEKAKGGVNWPKRLGRPRRPRRRRR